MDEFHVDSAMDIGVPLQNIYAIFLEAKNTKKNSEAMT